MVAGDTPVLVHNCGPHDNNYQWPKKDGFEGPSVNMELPRGYQFDRYGHTDPYADRGTFASPAGTPFDMRSLPASAASRPLTTYEVVDPFKADVGVVRPWYGRPGGGMQINMPDSIANLLKRGTIRVVEN